MKKVNILYFFRYCLKWCILMHSSSTKFRVSINTIIDLFKKTLKKVLMYEIINEISVIVWLVSQVNSASNSIQISVHLIHNSITINTPWYSFFSTSGINCCPQFLSFISCYHLHFFIGRKKREKEQRKFSQECNFSSLSLLFFLSHQPLVIDIRSHGQLWRNHTKMHGLWQNRLPCW